MKRKLIIAAAASAMAVSGGAYAQLNPGPFLQAGANDASKITNAYMGPFFKAFGAGLNAGWYTTAATHTRFFPDLSINTSAVFIPTADQTFDVNSLGLENLTVTAGSSNIAPTAAGSTSNTTYDLNAINPLTGKKQAIQQLKSPDGTGLTVLPVPSAQLGIGIGWGTDIMVRFMPTIKLGDNIGSIGLFGFGIKHDIKQWIPAVSLLPFDWSVLGGFTQFTYNLPISYPYDYSPAQNDPHTANFNFTAKTQAFNFGTIVSKTLLFFTGYIGLGYQMSTTTITIDGKVPAPGYDATGKSTTTYITIPDIKIDGANNPYANVGFRLKFLVLTINADYTFMSTYSNARLGLGISI